MIGKTNPFQISRISTTSLHGAGHGVSETKDQETRDLKGDRVTINSKDHPVPKSTKTQGETKTEIKETSGEVNTSPNTPLPSSKKPQNFSPCIAVIEETPVLGASISSIGGNETKAFLLSLQANIGESASIPPVKQTTSLPGAIPTITELNEAFQEIKNDESTPWGCIFEGCHCRAHTAAEKLLDRGYNVGKMFVSCPKGKSNLRAENEYGKGKLWYHVGAITFARDEKSGNVDGYIIDPTICKDRPIKVEEWIKTISDGKHPINLELTKADIYKIRDNERNIGGREFSPSRFKAKLVLAKRGNEDYNAGFKEAKKTGDYAGPIGKKTTLWQDLVFYSRLLWYSAWIK